MSRWWRWGPDRWRTLAAVLFSALLTGLGWVPWWLGGLIGGAVLVASWMIWPSGQTKRPAGPFDHWHDSVARGQTPCQTCVMLPVCGGACPKQWHEGNRARPPYNYGMSGRFDVIAEMNGLVPAESVEPGLVPACAAGLG